LHFKWKFHSQEISEREWFFVPFYAPHFILSFHLKCVYINVYILDYSLPTLKIISRKNSFEKIFCSIWLLLLAEKKYMRRIKWKENEKKTFCINSNENERKW
jgi:hypothetical protein